MTIKVRFAGPDDAEIVYRFIMDLAIYERDPEAVEVTPEILAKQMELHKPPFECLIAEENSEPVGFALFYHNYSPWIGKVGIYVEDIFVPPSLRRRGIGRLFRIVESVRYRNRSLRIHRNGIFHPVQPHIIFVEFAWAESNHRHGLLQFVDSRYYGG